MKSVSVPIKYGIFLSVILIGYFLVLSLFGLHTYVWFSLINGVLTGFGIFFGIRAYKQHAEDFNYPNGFLAGLTIGGLATVVFTLFFAIYASNINPSFIDNLVDMWNMLPNSRRAFAQLVMVVGLMGVVTTFILTLCCMQFFKDSWNTNHSQKQK